MSVHDFEDAVYDLFDDGLSYEEIQDLLNQAHSRFEDANAECNEGYGPCGYCEECSPEPVEDTTSPSDAAAIQAQEWMDAVAEEEGSEKSYVTRDPFVGYDMVFDEGSICDPDPYPIFEGGNFAPESVNERLDRLERLLNAVANEISKLTGPKTITFPEHPSLQPYSPPVVPSILPSIPSFPHNPNFPWANTPGIKYGGNTCQCGGTCGC